MRHQLKAVFDDRGKAQQALDKLLGSGYASADALVVAVPGARQDGNPDADTPRWRERSGASTARLLSRLFNHEHSDPTKAATGLRSPDSYVLTLATYSDAEAERAASLISGFIRADSEDVGTNTSGERANTVQGAYRGRIAPGALQYYARDDSSHYFGTRNPDDTSTIGTTFREPMLPAGHWPGTSPDGQMAQEMRTGPPAGDAGALPAYRFGHDMHENDRYRNRSWSEAAGDLKVLWETRDPVGQDWESSEPAVRLGWKSSSPEIDDDSYHRSHWKTSYVNSPPDAGSVHAPGSGTTSAVPGAAWKKRHPGELTAWENFMDALRHGWERIRIGNDMDEAGYRLHHANTYPGTNYDDFAPVYRYGHNLRRRRAFRDLGWDDVESELRTEWERGHREGKPSTWDKMKAALHHGWDQPKS